MISFRDSRKKQAISTKEKRRLIVISATRSEECKQIVHAKFVAFDLVSTERSCSERTFLLLQLEDAVLDSVCDRQLVDIHCTFLTETVGTVVGLVLLGEDDRE